MAEEIYEEVVEEVFEEIYEEVSEEVSEEVFEEVVEEATGTVNIANNTWYTNWGSDTINITANSDQVVFDMGYALTYEYAFAKACVKIDADKYESITFTYSEQYQSGNNGLRFGIYDNMYVSDTSGTIAIDQSDWSNSGGSVTINLSGISGMKYVGFVFDGSTYNFNEIIGWNCYRRVEITSIDAKKSVGSDGEASEEEIPEEVVEYCFLEYDSNGGSDVSSFETWVEIRSYATITSEIPTRIGHKFLGWSKSSSATSASYVAGDRIYIAENTTLYAVWQSPTVISPSVTNSSYSASITSTGGYEFYSFTPSTGGMYRFESSGDLDTYIHLYDSNESLLVNDDGGLNNNFLLDYNFTSGTKYYIKVRFWSSSTTGTINFTVKRLYTITYDANGGNGAPGSQTKAHGDDLTLHSITIPTRTGYTFLGWSTSSNATSATYSPGGSFTANETTTLYAVWEKKTYTINYNANDGNGAPSSQTKTHGTDLTLSSTVPTRFGYTFLGWSTSDSAVIVTHEPGDSFTIDANWTLYAVWQAAITISSDVTDSSYSTDITFNGGYKFYSFTPSTGGRYRFESISDSDTYIHLYDSNGSQIAYNDDGAGNGQFRLDYNFTSGAQYYIKVRFWSRFTTGTINFTVKRQGFVYICDSTGEFCPYQAFIYDGSNWNQYTPYIYNGSSWDLYN